MRRVGLLLLAGCVEKTTEVTSAPPPPLPEQLPGSYLATWIATGGSAGDELAAEIQSDSVVAFNHYPCFALSGQEDIGGPYDYDLAGHFHAELKTLDGSTKVLIDGAFSSDGALDAGYQVLFLATKCEEGQLIMRGAP